MYNAVKLLVNYHFQIQSFNNIANLYIYNFCAAILSKIRAKFCAVVTGWQWSCLKARLCLFRKGSFVSLAQKDSDAAKTRVSDHGRPSQESMRDSSMRSDVGKWLSQKEFWSIRFGLMLS